MRKLKITEEFKAYTEEEAIQALNDLRANQNKEGYTLGANGYKYKTKKAKGEIVAEQFLVKIAKVYGGVWDDYE
jgi:hypothetical protein